MKNFALLFILGIAKFSNVGGWLLWECPGKKCDDSQVKEAFGAVNVLPNEEELKNICKLGLELFDCQYEEVKECTGQSVLELAASSNETLSSGATAIISLFDFAVDICNEDAQLHKDYVENVDCVKAELFSGRKNPCEAESDKVIASFFAATTPDFQERLNDPIFFKDFRCLGDAYTLACTAGKLGKVCAQGAKRGFIAVARALSTGFETVCSPSGKEMLRGDFLNSLKLEAEENNFYSTFFELFKRK